MGLSGEEQLGKGFSIMQGVPMAFSNPKIEAFGGPNTHL